MPHGSEIGGDGGMSPMVSTRAETLLSNNLMACSGFISKRSHCGSIDGDVRFASRAATDSMFGTSPESWEGLGGAGGELNGGFSSKRELRRGCVDSSMLDSVSAIA